MEKTVYNEEGIAVGEIESAIVTFKNNNTKKTHTTLIQTPFYFRTDVNGKTIENDPDIKEYIIQKIHHYFSQENVGKTMYELFSSWGQLRDRGERDLSSKLSTRDIHINANNISTEVLHFNTALVDKDGIINLSLLKRYGFKKSSFDKVSNTKWGWLRLISTLNAEQTKENQEQYEDLIWKVWGKHTDLNAIKDYPVYIKEDVDMRNVVLKDRHQRWKHYLPTHIITASLKGATKFDALRKYKKGITQLENIKLVPLQEVIDGEYMCVGTLNNRVSRIEQRRLPKESVLIERNSSIREEMKGINR